MFAGDRNPVKLTRKTHQHRLEMGRVGSREREGRECKKTSEGKGQEGRGGKGEFTRIKCQWFGEQWGISNSINHL